jgi:hypothetical protein
VRRTPEEPLFNSLLEQYHYHRYKQPAGEHLKFLVYAGERPVACFAWSSSAHYLGCRDRFLGWSDQAGRKNLHLLAYNPRFLILPWVEIPHLASHLLARMPRESGSAPTVIRFILWNLHRFGTVPRDMLSRGQLDGIRSYDRPREERLEQATQPPH